MKNCDNCGTEINDKYKWCADCVAKYRKTNGETTSKSWHDDPVVDALLKMNANLGQMNKNLERIAVSLEERR